MPGPDLDDDFELLKDAVREAGELARKLALDEPEHWKKSDGTPVSEADLKVNALLERRLAGGRDGYGWLSEETRDDASRLTRDRVWVVDPIDGTKAFLKGDPHWTICAALVEQGAPVLSAVFNPMTHEFFDAALGQGARLNGETISVTRRTALEDSRMLMHGFVLRSDKWAEPWPRLTAEMRNSVAYRLCLVASGEFDGAIVISDKSEWDLAAADLLVHEAGGAVSDHNGGRFAYNRADARLPGVLAAGPGLYDGLLVRTRQRRKD